MSIMINKLLKYLHPDFATYHIRSINLIWALQSMTKRSYVESILAQSLTSTDTRSTADAFEAFGVLWRLSGKCQGSDATVTLADIFYQTMLYFLASISRCP